MNLHQLRLDFDPEQDRLLLRIATSDGKEMSLWLTRRLVKLLWPLLVGLARSSATIVRQSSPEARAALLGFEHERAVRNVDFSRPYDADVREQPLGPAPLLVTKIQSSTDSQGNHVLSLAAPSGQLVNISMDDTLLHSFCGLLQKVVGESEWDLVLSIASAPVEDSEAASRTIN